MTDLKKLCELEAALKSRSHWIGQRCVVDLLPVETDAILAAIALLKPIAEGRSVVVPVVPTEAMLKSGAMAFYSSKEHVFAARMPDVYRAMLQAAQVKP